MLLCSDCVNKEETKNEEEEKLVPEQQGKEAKITFSGVYLQ